MYERESFKEIVSMNWNWLTGGSLRECYCSRMWREERMNRVYILNWIYFIISGCNDIGHCQRVARGGSK